jgi:hypothetical protein
VGISQLDKKREKQGMKKGTSPKRIGCLKYDSDIRTGLAYKEPSLVLLPDTSSREGF